MTEGKAKKILKIYNWFRIIVLLILVFGAYLLSRQQ